MNVLRANFLSNETMVKRNLTHTFHKTLPLVLHLASHMVKALVCTTFTYKTLETSCHHINTHQLNSVTENQHVHVPPRQGQVSIACTEQFAIQTHHSGGRKARLVHDAAADLLEYFHELGVVLLLGNLAHFQDDLVKARVPSTGWD